MILILKVHTVGLNKINKPSTFNSVHVVVAYIYKFSFDLSELLDSLWCDELFWADLFGRFIYLSGCVTQKTRLRCLEKVRKNKCVVMSCISLKLFHASKRSLERKLYSSTINKFRFISINSNFSQLNHIFALKNGIWVSFVEIKIKRLFILNILSLSKYCHQCIPLMLALGWFTALPDPSPSCWSMLHSLCNLSSYFTGRKLMY